MAYELWFISHFRKLCFDVFKISYDIAIGSVFRWGRPEFDLICGNYIYTTVNITGLKMVKFKKIIKILGRWTTENHWGNTESLSQGCWETESISIRGYGSLRRLEQRGSDPAVSTVTQVSFPWRSWDSVDVVNIREPRGLGCSPSFLKYKERPYMRWKLSM